MNRLTHETLQEAADECVDEMITNQRQKWKNDGAVKNMKHHNLGRDERIPIWQEIVIDAAEYDDMFINVNDRLGEISEADADYLMDLIVDQLDNHYMSGQSSDDAYERAMQIL